MVELTRSTSGLLFQADGTLTGLTGPGQWTSVAEPAYVIFDPSPMALLSPLDSECRDGIRESQLYVEGGLWHLFYSGGDGQNGWRSFHATSTDRGLTWVRHGVMSDGISKVGGGSWGAVDLGWVEKRGSTYIKHRVTADGSFSAPNTGLPGGHYNWDIWTTSDLVAVPWSGVRDMGADGSGWGQQMRYPCCVVLNAGTYLGFASGVDGGSHPTVGIATAATPSGAFVSVPGAQFVSTSPLDNYGFENPRVFLSPTLGVWVMLGNAFVNPGGWNGRNLLYTSASLTDWSAAIGRFLQTVCPMDAANAIGVITHVTGPDGSLVYDAATGCVPVVYDADAQRFGPNASGWHLGRRLRTAVMEPSPRCLRYSGSGDLTERKLTRALTHTDAVIELSCEAPVVNGGGGSLTVEYRSDGTGNNYRAELTSGGTFSLYKVVAGVKSLLAGGAGSQTLDATHMQHRIRVIVQGNTHTLVLDGEQQVAYTDAASPIASGSVLALAGKGLDCDLRLLSVRTSTTVTVEGLVPGESCVVRSYGGFPMGAIVADGSGSGTFGHPHSPLWCLDLNGTDYVPAGGIWGGDTLTFSGLSARGPVGLPSLALI